MNLKTDTHLRVYTVSVSVVAVIGLLLTVAPLVRSALEYRSPASVDMRDEFASVETFILANGKTGPSEEAMRAADRRSIYMSGRWDHDEWKAMYEAAKTHHVEGVRRRAARNIVAYGALCGLCVVLLITHLLWARRLS